MTSRKSYSKQSKNQVSDKIVEEAANIAKGTQKPGQTKEQTKLIAQGIQKGIDQYKKQQKAKARELDKQLKKAKIAASEPIVVNTDTKSVEPSKPLSKLLPWTLLILSWGGFAAYVSLKA